MYKGVNFSSGSSGLDSVLQIVNEDKGEIVFVTSNEYRVYIIYQIPDEICD